MDPVVELTEWIETHFDRATSFALEQCPPDSASFRTYRTGKMEGIEPSEAAQTIVEWARQIRKRDEGIKYHAMLRIRDDDGGSAKTIKNFFLPMDVDDDNPMALTESDLAANPGLKIFMQLVNGERKRTETALNVSKMREDKLFETLIDTIGVTKEDRLEILAEMRTERAMLLGEMREERQSHRDSIGPILTESAKALANAAELVRVHQESNTAVQLAKLEHEAEEKKWNLILEGAAAAKEFLGKRKKRKQTAVTAGPKEDVVPPKTGVTRQLFLIIEKLTDEQLDKMKQIVGDDWFKRLDDAAHAGDDTVTRETLTEFEAASKRDPKRIWKTLSLANLMGAELAERFVALFDTESAVETDVVDDAPADAEVVELIRPNGFVEGLRECGLADLDDEMRVKVAEIIGPGLVGVLEAAAEGNDEMKAIVALCSVGKGFQDLAESDAPLAESRFHELTETLGIPDEQLANLIGRAADAAPEKP